MFNFGLEESSNHQFLKEFGGEYNDDSSEAQKP
jgi:hypothetical protein